MVDAETIFLPCLLLEKHGIHAKNIPVDRNHCRHMLDIANI